MKQLSLCLQELFVQLGLDYKKIAQAGFNRQTYKNAVMNIWKSQPAAKMILERTNAVYIRRDETIKVKKSYIESGECSSPNSADVVCEICVEDSMVLSELNAHREILALMLKTNGLTFEEIRLIHSKGAMRKRHPFIEEDDFAQEQER